MLRGSAATCLSRDGKYHIIATKWFWSPVKI